MKKILFFLCIITISLASCKGSKKTTKTPPKPGVQFMQSKTLSDVLDRAKAENKLVFVDFYTTWCLPCKLMDEDVFPNKEIGDFMNENFISYKVDAEKGNGLNLRTVFDVYLYPTLVFLDTNGRVLERKEGAAYHTELRAMGERALSTVQ